MHGYRPRSTEILRSITKSVTASRGQFRWPVDVFIAIGLALAVLAPHANAGRYWVDTYKQQLWETSTDACQDGEAEPRVAAKRLEQPSLIWRYADLHVTEFGSGTDAQCIFTIQRRVGFVWVDDTYVDQLIVHQGIADVCPRDTLDPITASCPPKMLGCPNGPDNGTNPCDGATGNKFEVETDYEGAGFGALQFNRYYNSLRLDAGALGHNWQSNWHRRVLYSRSNNRTTVVRETGQGLVFTLLGGQWVADADVRETLTQVTSGGNPAGWQFRTINGGISAQRGKGEGTSRRWPPTHVYKAAGG